MNNKCSASHEASSLIEEFLAANSQPTSEQWKALAMANPKYAVQIADAALFLSPLETEDHTETPFDTELFNATRSAMLSAVEASTAPVEAAKAALRQCRGPAARSYARQIGLGEHVDLFNQMVSGEALAPYVVMKRLAAELHVRLAAMKEVFSLNFHNRQVQSFKADGKPNMSSAPTSWENAVRAAGITGAEASRLLDLEQEQT